MIKYTKYYRTNSVVFKKNKDAYGGFSNMSNDYPITLGDLTIPTVEVLYQAMKFPMNIDAQKIILGEKSPMSAKFKARKFKDSIRLDWEDVKVNIMYWCLQLKLYSNYNSFSKELLHTGDKDIVEESNIDQFWGAMPIDDQTLLGENQLGKLLMRLRSDIQTNTTIPFVVEPVNIPDFILLGEIIQRISIDGIKTNQIGQISFF